MGRVPGIAWGVVLGIGIAVAAHAQTDRADDDATSASDERTRERFEILDLVVTEGIFAEVAKTLELTSDQRVVAEGILRDYLVRAHQLDALTQQRVDDAGMREMRETSIGQYRLRGEEPPWDKLSQLAIQSREEYVRGLERADELLEQFYERLETVLTPDQAEQMRAVRRDVRWLNVLRDDATTGGFGDFRSRIDFDELLARATEEGNEFALLDADHPDPEGIYAQTRAQIEARIEDYEREYDIVIVQDSYQSSREPYDEDHDVRIGPDDPRRERIITNWNKSHNLTERTARAIGMIVLEPLGPEAHDRWLNRYRAAFCPELYQPRLAEHVFESVFQAQTVSEEERRNATIAYERYLTRRHQLRKEAVTAGITALRKHISEHGTEPRQLDYAAKRLELRQLIQKTINDFRAIASEANQVLVDELATKAKSYNTRLLGPGLSAEQIEALTGEPQPPVEIVIHPGDYERDK